MSRPDDLTPTPDTRHPTRPVSHAIPNSEHLIVVVGPSGAGKDSVLAAWARLRAQAGGPPLWQARRSITRPAEAEGGEQHEPVDDPTFQRLQKQGAWATAWHANGLSYGVRWQEFAPLARGDWVVLNSSRAHLPSLRQQAPHMAVVEITAPPALRAQRIAARGRETADEITARLQRDLPVDGAALRVVNDGAVEDAAQTLQQWWQGHAQGAD